MGLFPPSHLQKVSNPKNGAVHLPAPAHLHVDTMYTSDPCCIGLPNGPIQLNATAVTAFDCLKNTLPTTHCGVLHFITMTIYCHHAFGDGTLQDWKNERPKKTDGKKSIQIGLTWSCAAARVHSSVRTIYGTVRQHVRLSHTREKRRKPERILFASTPGAFLRNSLSLLMHAWWCSKARVSF